MGKSITQSAGRLRLSTSTYGHPYWMELEIDGEKIMHPNGAGTHFKPSDMHDLRYCIDRVLAELEAETGVRP